MAMRQRRNARNEMSAPTYGPGIEITGRITDSYAEILTPDAVSFAARGTRTR